jgi:hypothetical protein
MQSINMFSTYGKLQLFFFTIPTSKNTESVWSLFGTCWEPVGNRLAGSFSIVTGLVVDDIDTVGHIQKKAVVSLVNVLLYVGKYQSQHGRNHFSEGLIDDRWIYLFSVHVNLQMGTNFVLERGVPKWEFLSLPACFHMGTPHMETGIVVLAVHWVMHQAPLHHPFPYDFHTGIPIWKWGLTHPRILRCVWPT